MWGRSKGAPLFRFLAMIYFPSNFPLVLTKTREYWWSMLLRVSVGSLYVYDYHWSTALLFFYENAPLCCFGGQCTIVTQRRAIYIKQIYRHVIFRSSKTLSRGEKLTHDNALLNNLMLHNGEFVLCKSFSFLGWLNAFKAVERPLGPRVPCSIAGTKPWLRSWPRQKHLHERFQCCRWCPKSLI